MNLAYKKILGKFTKKVLGFGKTPPHVGKNSQIISFFFFESVPKPYQICILLCSLLLTYLPYLYPLATPTPLPTLIAKVMKFNLFSQIPPLQCNKDKLCPRQTIILLPTHIAHFWILQTLPLYQWYQFLL